MGEIGSGSGSSYPGALDTDATPEVNSPGAGKTKVRAEVDNDQSADIVAIETALGINPQGTIADVKTYLQTEHNTDATHKAALVAMLAGTQTITGDKTISGLLTSTTPATKLVGIVGVVDKVSADTTVANTTTETNIYSFSVPGGTVGTNNRLVLTILCK